MRTRPASIATIVVAIGLALTTIGVARGLPYTFAGVGSRLTIGADLWAHGTAVSPALVALFFVGILAAVAMRPTRGGQRAASSLAILAAALVITGLAEPAQLDLVLFSSVDLALTPLVVAFHVGLVAITLSAVGEARRDGSSTSVTSVTTTARSESAAATAASPDSGPAAVGLSTGVLAAAWRGHEKARRSTSGPRGWTAASTGWSR